MTANAMVGDREKVLAAGMNDHIAKPIKFDDMFATLARWVHPAGAAASRPLDGANGAAGADPFAGLSGIDTHAGLAGMMGDTTLYRRLLCVFRDDQGAFESRFNAARAAGDIDTLTRLAHDLKSAAAALGVHAVQHEASVLEEACKRQAGDIDALGQNVARLLGPVIASLQVLGPKHAP